MNDNQPYPHPTNYWQPDGQPQPPHAPAHPGAQPRMAWNNARPHQEFSGEVHGGGAGQAPAPAQPASAFPGSFPVHVAPQQAAYGQPAAYPQQAQPAAYPQQAQPAPQPQHGFIQPGMVGGAVPMSMQNGVIHPAAPQQAYVHGGGPAPMMQQPQAQQWGYATPHGTQLVQGGDVQFEQPYVQPVATIRRIRWDVIVPAAAVVMFIVAAILFAKDFDTITGRTAAAPKAAAAVDEASTASAADTAAPAVIDDAPAALVAAEVTTQLTHARKLMAAGRYDEAQSMLHTMLEAPNAEDFPAIARLDEQVDGRAAREKALLTRLGSQQGRADWTGAIATLTALKRLRPLAADERGILRTATKKSRAAATTRAAAKRKAAATHKQQPATRGGSAAPAPGGSAASSSRPTTKPPKPSAGTPKPPKPPGVANTGGGGNGIGAGNMAGMDMSGMDMGDGHNHAH